MDADDRQLVWQLLHEHRWAALAVTDAEGAAQVSFVAFALGPAGDLILHLSELAAHTRHLRRDPRAALGISAADEGGEDPQRLPRIALQGALERIPREAETYQGLRQRYLQRLPAAARLFSFGDFSLYVYKIYKARYVGGFGKAHSISGEELRKLATTNTTH
ncbi:MAG TPA: pyridoxamine 5'-phosphate oxidase [Gammaproteobacteria bacterium]|nr:pyridoxamine 5'-phosphate oxidase [Gammaproteobacteria bacterium]